MLPKWFDKWNKDHPTDIFGPAIIFGVLGTAVIFVAFLVVAGQPFATASTQTGPRGTGMSIPEFKTALAAGDPTIEDFYTDDPIKPIPNEPLAKDIYENVQVLGDLTEDNFNRLMNAMTVWVAPDEGCAYCHGDVDLEEYGKDDLYTKVVSRRMIEMTQFINEEWDGHVQANGEVGVNCSTCHRGQNVPSNIWFDNSNVTHNTAGWSANQNRASSTSSATSLPSDALQKLLVEGAQITVHDLESRVAGSPSDDGFRSIQDTERTYALMNYFANSLGVNCNFCHNSRAFYAAEEVTPQWSTASLGIFLVQEINNEYLIPLRDTYPENRLGAKNADAPKAACATCHKGYSQPYQGLNAIGDWPELATTEPPEYE